MREKIVLFAEELGYSFVLPLSTSWYLELCELHLWLIKQHKLVIEIKCPDGKKEEFSWTTHKQHSYGAYISSLDDHAEYEHALEEAILRTLDYIKSQKI